MPWLSKYRAMRRSRLPELEHDIEEGTTDGSSPAASPPMRAVTLVNPQAYALRATSLIPVASGAALASTSTTFFGKRLHSLIDDDSTGEEKDEEIQRLQDQVLELKMQLQLQQVAPLPPAAFNSPKRNNRFDTSSPKPGWEDDYELPPPPKPEDDSGLKSTPQPHHVNGDDMVGRPHSHESPQLSARVYRDRRTRLPSALKRNKSKGLPPMQPPASRLAQEVSWADHVYKVDGNT